MGQKFFISFNSADRTKAHWIAWTLKNAGHEVAVHDWEIPAGGNAPLWMNTKLAWADPLNGLRKSGTTQMAQRAQSFRLLSGRHSTFRRCSATSVGST
jgi:hypothetical protein